MARPLRLQAPGILYHITSRGDGRDPIYFTDYDRRHWLSLLGETCERYDWVCHSYCLMGNHYHFVVETKKDTLSTGMRHLNGVYTQYINRTKSRVGHVFQGRFHSVIVDKQAYLVELGRYVVLNPVRADLVQLPDEWRWSSYRDTAGLNSESPPDWLETEFTLKIFGESKGAAQLAYRKFVLCGMGKDSIWTELKDQIYLGGDSFIEKRKAEGPGNAQEVPQCQRNSRPKPIAAYRKAHVSRKRAMAAAYASGDYTLLDIAAEFGVHYTTVSRAAKAWRTR